TLRVLQAPEGVPEIGARRLDPGGGPFTMTRLAEECAGVVRDLATGAAR
ncbi:MAG: hypothetical protein INR72_14845, partial [Williamsia herbipolensis]|nr:hypothetical protein [Williamsia herbipolensis]